jgi:hypothetical protein
MITAVRSARIRLGKAQEAIAFAKDVCSIAKDIAGLQLRAMMQVGGQLGVVCWVSETKNLGEYEEVMAKLVTDPRWQKLHQSVPDLFADGELSDQLWRSL